MVKGRRARIMVVLLVVLAVGYIGRLSVSAAQRSGGPSGTTQTTATTRPGGSTSQPTDTTTTTTVAPPKRVVHRLLKDSFISPEGMPPQAVTELLNYAQAAGVKIISTGVSWAAFEPYGPGGPGEFAQLDTFVSEVLHRKMKVRIQLTGFPDWARDPGEVSSATAQWLPPVAPDELARWKVFVGDVARHFRGRVTYFEIWNEPNISSFFYPQPDPAEYADLLEASSTAIKAADPSALVIFAGMSGNDIGFLSRVYDALDAQFGALARKDHHFFDILGAHPYDGSRPPEVVSPSQVYPDDFGTMDANFLGFEKLHALMASHGEGYKPIYITEYGFTTEGFYGFPPISDSTRAAYLKRAFSLVAKIPYVIGFSWFCLYANPDNGLANGPGWAMLAGYYPYWQPNATYAAFKSVP
jgi:hypothetical protein